jgi:uncharacterized protein YfkK (UPF0435 family)
MDFNQLKKQSKTGIAALTEKLLKDAETLNSGRGYADDLNQFKLETDKAGNGKAIIRFLPAPNGEEKEFVRLYNHGFAVKGKWFIENCPTTIGEPCPVCESNGNYWESGVESDKVIARDRKRKLSYYANIYIISNPANRELEGTVKIFRFGQKILDKIVAAMKPEFDGDPVIQPFCFWNGANFRLISKTTKTLLNGKERSMPNYDDSKFEEKSEFLNGDDTLLEQIYNQLHSLEDIVNPATKFKSYEDLQKRFNMITKNSRLSTSSVEEQERELDQMMSPKEDILAELETSYANLKDTSMRDDEDDEDIRRFMALAES